MTGPLVQKGSRRWPEQPSGRDLTRVDTRVNALQYQLCDRRQAAVALQHWTCSALVRVSSRVSAAPAPLGFRTLRLPRRFQSSAPSACGPGRLALGLVGAR